MMKLLVATTSLALGAAGPAAATIVFDNSIPLASVDIGASSQLPDFISAASFSLTAPTTFDGIEFSGFYTTGTASDPAFNFAIHVDSGSLPGATVLGTVFSTAAGAADETDTGADVVGSSSPVWDIYSYAVSLPGQVTLAAGDYWLTI